MVYLGPLLFKSPLMMAAAGGIALITICAAILRTINLSRRAALCLLTGLTSLILAAGSPAWLTSADRQVAVMIDLSPSTRGAAYRDPSYLRHRIDQLLARRPDRIYFFAADIQPGSLDAQTPLSDLPADQTAFTPPPADAVLLFSDGQFPAPANSPPVYPVLDPLLENSSDAAITGMEFIGGQIAVSVTNNGPPRTLTIHTSTGITTRPVQGNQTILIPATGKVWAELSPGDRWPENDTLSIESTPSVNSQHWWIGVSPPPGWRAMQPGQLPTEPTGYLPPAVIVLNNIPAAALTATAQDRLEQYVRDLGGAVVLCGGDHALRAGLYNGTPLESISPLSTLPPTPAMEWILLTDASGSMSQDGQWDSAVKAVVNLLPLLPPMDTVRVGQFSDTLRWWSQGLPARQTAQLNLPPPTALPHGPTNLQPALEAIASHPSGRLTQLLLITDADTVIDHPADLALRLKNTKIQLHLLAIARGQGLADLQDIARDTGGSFVTQVDADSWPAAAQAALSSALPEAVVHSSINIHFLGPAAAIPSAQSDSWNPAWIKPQAVLLAQEDNSRPLAATWHYGIGQVITTAFPTTPDQAVALATLIEQSPRDPRLQVTWQSGPTCRVAIDAINGKQYLNDLKPSLDVWQPDTSHTTTYPINQIAPGRYEAWFPPQSTPAIATVRIAGRTIDRTALAGWYPPEFAHIGSNLPALQSLAQNSGGRVVSPPQTTPLDFHWAQQRRELTAPLAAAAALLLAAGILLRANES